MTMAAQPSVDAFGALATADTLSDAGIDARARKLTDTLTFDEKLGLMHGDLPFWKGLAAMMAPGGYSGEFWVAGAVPRLGIPGIRFVDGPRGVVMKGATAFPVSMARGATFDPDLEQRIGEAIGREVRALGGNFFGGVCINLLRHPAWGRAQETYSEDTHHLGIMGAALATGVQKHVMACVKHFALNSMENARQEVDVSIDARALHEVYLPHFKRVVDAGVAAVMTAYNKVNGVSAGQNRVLITEILKSMWRFGGFVVTDFITGMRDAKTAALAGQDVEMPFAGMFAWRLKGLVAAGEVPAARIEDAALRLLRQQVRFGQGHDLEAYGPETVGAPAHRQLAREAAAKSIVLLKNEGSVLPLAGRGKIAVIGRLADQPNTGDGGSSDTHPAYVVTPLAGLREALGGNATIVYDDGSDEARAARAAQGADAAVVVVGYTHADEGEYIPPDQLTPYVGLFPPPGPGDEMLAASVMKGRAHDSFALGGDRVSLRLRPEDEALIEAVAAANPRTIVAIMAGSAVITESWRQAVPAIVMLWYPGMEGGHAFADVLTGRVNPGGRLPCTFPASADDLPFFDRDARAVTYDLWHGYRKLLRDGAAPAFPFGFGLSYTRFDHRHLVVEESRLAARDTLSVRVDITNSGERSGEDVVQLYIAVPGSKIERAPRELKAFARVRLGPGETRTIALAVPISELAWYDSKAGWTVEPTEYQAIVAHHAHDPGLAASFEVVAQT
jgi:beta-glucosidase